MFELEKLTVKPTAPAIPPERLISEQHCVNCGHLYNDHLVGMNTVQTGECRHCVCHEPETASRERLWEDRVALINRLTEAEVILSGIVQNANSIGVRNTGIALHEYMEKYGEKSTADDKAKGGL